MLTAIAQSKRIRIWTLQFLIGLLGAIALFVWLFPKGLPVARQVRFGPIPFTYPEFAYGVFLRFFLKEWLGEPMSIAVLRPCEPERIKTMLENKDKFPATLFNEENGQTYCSPIRLRVNRQQKEHFNVHMPDVNGCERTVESLKALLSQRSLVSLRVKPETFAKYQPNMSRRHPRAYEFHRVAINSLDIGSMAIGDYSLNDIPPFNYLSHSSGNGFCVIQLKFEKKPLPYNYQLKDWDYDHL